MKNQGAHQKGEQKKSRQCDANVVYLLRDEEVPPHKASDKLGCTRARMTYTFMLKLLYAGCGWWVSIYVIFNKRNTCKSNKSFSSDVAITFKRPSGTSTSMRSIFVNPW